MRALSWGPVHLAQINDFEIIYRLHPMIYCRTGGILNIPYRISKILSSYLVKESRHSERLWTKCATRFVARIVICEFHHRVVWIWKLSIQSTDRQCRKYVTK